MKNKMRIMAAFLMGVVTVGVLTFGANTSSKATAASASPSVKLDGKYVPFPDALPYVNEDNRTMVPLRFISEALGCKVTWEDTNQLVTITKVDKRILLRIGENWAIINDTKSDVKKEFDTKAVLKNERTMVPLRFISETLGVGVAWDEAKNTVVLRSDGVVEVVATPTPAPAATPAIPVPTGTPSPLNPIPGNPYYGNGLTCKEDLARYLRLQPLFNYNDIDGISGDYDKKDLGRVIVAYGCWNPYQKRYQGYLTVDARESDKSFDISISKGGEKEIQRLREVINIAVIGEQEYKDFVFNSVMSCKNGFKGGTIQYKDGSYLTVTYDTSESCNRIWGDEAFFVNVWR